MAYIEPLAARSANLFVRIVYWFARRRLGKLPTPVQVMAHNGPVLAAMVGYELGLERAEKLDRRLKELATLKAATLIGCRFCIDIGTSISRRFGIEPETLLDLPVYETSARFTPLEKRVLEYTVAMTETPMRVTRALSDALRAELGIPALVELTSVVAWENHRARFNHAIGAEEEGFSDQTVCLLPPRELAPVSSDAASRGAAALRPVPSR